MTDRALSVVRSGALTTVQDLGRPGHAHLGVPRSGALDGPAAALANRLVGNRPEAAVLETTLNGCAVRPRSTVTVILLDRASIIRAGSCFVTAVALQTLMSYFPGCTFTETSGAR